MPPPLWGSFVKSPNNTAAAEKMRLAMIMIVNNLGVGREKRRKIEADEFGIEKCIDRVII